MNTNTIIVFRGIVAATASRSNPGHINKRDCRAELRRQTGRTCAIGRVVPIMVWHVDPVSGRPECRWVLQGSEATDEGGSRGRCLRHAA